jgi:hypothetical protein
MTLIMGQRDILYAVFYNDSGVYFLENELYLLVLLSMINGHIQEFLVFIYFPSFFLRG